MKEILFIVLTIVSSPSYNYGEADSHTIWENGIGKLDEGIKDEWNILGHYGDTVGPEKAFYKAIIFYDENSFHRFLKKYKMLDSDIVIDIKQGKKLNITQKEIIEKKTKVINEHKGYSFKIDEV